jgi:hypothetical protein
MLCQFWYIKAQYREKEISMLVKIVRLLPFRAASFHVKESETPERDAWVQVEAWAKPRR